jgi:threonine/homoserine/homoserine lactone efflux protein
MHEAITLLIIFGAILIGAVSPGPSFLLVARTSIGVSRSGGLAMAAGMGTGAVIFAVLTLIGLRALLTEVTWLYLGLKILGGSYLLFLAFNLWRNANEPLTTSESPHRNPIPLRKSFSLALVTQISNPKTAIYYGSIFVAVLPAAPPDWMLAILPFLVFTIEAGWYALVAVAFSSERPRAAYLRFKGKIDRLAAIVMGGLGVRLILDTAQA